MRLVIAFTIFAFPALADTVVAARMLRPQTIISAQDLVLKQADIAGGFKTTALIIGQEARVVIYPGRPVLQSDIGPPALIERNQIVTLIYDTGGLSIITEGRALGRAGNGDRIRVMNLSSRATVSGSVLADGTVRVPQ